MTRFIDWYVRASLMKAAAVTLVCIIVGAGAMTWGIVGLLSVATQQCR